jgi:hypothetical protein
MKNKVDWIEWNEAMKELSFYEMIDEQKKIKRK